MRIFMIPKYTLIPGFKPFMEDINTANESNDSSITTTPENIDKVIQASEEGEQEGITIAKLDRLTNQLSYLIQEYETWNNRLEYVREYGVDRTFMRLFNSNGEFNQAFNISLPSCEDFSPIGNKYSHESKAVIAGLEGILGDIWDWICNLFRKIKEFFTGSSSSMSSSVSSTTSNLNNIMKKLKINPDWKNLHLPKGTMIYDPNTLKKVVQWFDKYVLPSGNDGLFDGGKEFYKAVASSTNIVKKLSSSSPDKWESIFTNDDRNILKAAKVAAEKYLSKIQEARNSLANLLKVKVDGSTFTIDTLLTHVSAWNDFTPKYETLENEMKKLSKHADEIEKDAQKLSKIQAKDKALKISQETGLAIGQIATTLRKEQNLAMQSARAIERAFRLIGIQISRAMNEKEKQDKSKKSKTTDYTKKPDLNSKKPLEI